MSRSDILARLRKIESLARQGVGGEADNAAALLDRVARAHGIDLDSLEAVQVSDRIIRVGTDGWRHQLLCQIVWRRDRSIAIYATHSNRRGLPRTTRGRAKPFDAIRMRCANDFFIEVAAAFEILSRDYIRQRKAFFRAFLDANDLLITPGDNDKPRDLSDAERQLVEDAARLSLGIERSRLHKELPGF